MEIGHAGGVIVVVMYYFVVSLAVAVIIVAMMGAGLGVGGDVGVSGPSSGAGYRPCMITQRNPITTGRRVATVGRHMEAKLSCRILSLLNPQKYQYVHTPFADMNDANAYEVEHFLNLGREVNVSHNKVDPPMSGAELSIFFRQIEASASSGFRCDPDKEYVVENCWEVLYSPPYSNKIGTVRGQMESMYNWSAKPDIGFSTSKENVVAYISQRDAQDGRLNKFFETAIRYFVLTYSKDPSRVAIWIESDSSYSPFFKTISNLFGKDIINLPTNQNNFFQTLHRLVRADELIFATSNVAMASVLLSNARAVFVPTGTSNFDDNSGDGPHFHQQFVQDNIGQFQVIDVAHETAIGNLAFMNGMLVDIKHPKSSAPPCLITQSGSDGFGHQLEGKLSCALLSSIWSARFKYLHTPFRSIEHDSSGGNSLEALKIEEFVNIGGSFDQINNVTAGVDQSPILRWLELEQFVSSVRQFDLPPTVCKANYVYVVDNCWGLTYAQPVLPLLDRERLKMRAAYLQTPKPETGFDADKKNVVVHMRAGDSKKQHRFNDADEAKYFQAGVQYYINRFNTTDVVFWIESDSPTWDVIGKIDQFIKSSTSSRASTRLPDPKTPLLTLFHRMVMADGIVMSPSSLSNAAALLSAAESLVITSGEHGAHTNWMNQPRFVRL
jgi:hypothetical protein